MSNEAMTDGELAAIEALAIAAQAGPWTMGPGPYYAIDTAEGRPLIDSWFFADAAFVASARTDVPRLVAEVRRLRALLAQPASRLTGAADIIELECDPDAEALSEERGFIASLRAALTARRASVDSSGRGAAEDRGA